MPSTSTTRLERLAGDGENRGGGGLPLPPLFHTIAAELLDRGESTVEELVRPVEKELEFKRERGSRSQEVRGDRGGGATEAEVLYAMLD